LLLFQLECIGKALVTNIEELKERTSILSSIQKNTMAISIKTSTSGCDRFGATKLMQAAREGLWELVIDEFIIAPDVNINAYDNHGYTALMYAVIGGNEYIVKELISKGADVNAKSKWGTTALAIAASMCETKVSQRAVGRGETICKDDYYGENIILEGNRTIIRYLIAAEADVNAKNTAGETPLMQAIPAGDEKTIEMLISAGADVSAKNDKGETPLAICASVAKESGWFNKDTKERIETIRQILIDAGAKH